MVVLKYFKLLLLLLLYVMSSSNNHINAQNWNEYLKAVASDREIYDEFGYSVSISGNYAIVGSHKEDYASGDNAGAAYIFKNNSGTWSQYQKIVASDRESGDNFGVSVSISGDYAIVGAELEDHDAAGVTPLNDAGSAYVFYNDSGTWTQVQKIVASDRTALDYFGISVSISGNYAIVGAYLEDHDAVGGSSKNGAGSAYIFYNDGGTWSQFQKIVSSDRAAGDYFGKSVSISGDYAIVGAYSEDEDADGNNTLNSAGSAYIFYFDTSTWSQAQKIVASDREASDNFGESVSISGDYAIVGAQNEDPLDEFSSPLNVAGSAYIFKNTSGTWSQVQKAVASDREANDNFGKSVSISGDYAIVGALNEDHDSEGGNLENSAGSAYIFKNTAGTWSQVQKIVASDRNGSDNFGASVSISGDYAIAGAYNEDEDAAGSNTLSGSGSAYIFGNDDVLPVELISFTATVNNSIVTLFWQTATEVNNYGFEIGRASFAQRGTITGQIEWETIGFVEGHGNSNSSKCYSFVDENPVGGTHLRYRLKQINFDGSYDYYDEIEIAVDPPLRIELKQNYPNPFNPATAIKFSLNEETKVSINIFDSVGQEVVELLNETKPAGSHITYWNGKNKFGHCVASGVYIYKLTTGTGLEISKKMNLLK